MGLWRDRPLEDRRGGACLQPLFLAHCFAFSSCLSFPFPSVPWAGPVFHDITFSSPMAALTRCSRFSPFPFTKDVRLFFCLCIQGRREHCVLMVNPLHFPEVLSSVAHELLIFSRLVCFVQTAAFLELGRPLCFGEAYCFTVRPSDSCYLRPERRNCQRWEPEAATSWSLRTPSSLAPTPVWDHPRKDTSVTPNVRGGMQSFSTSLGLSLSPWQGWEASDPSVRTSSSLPLSFSLFDTGFFLILTQSALPHVILQVLRLFLSS